MLIFSNQNHYIMSAVAKKNGNGNATRSLFPTFRSLMDSFWDSDNFFGREFPVNEFFNRAWTPAVNIKDNTKTYSVEVAAPGLKKDDFNVTIENGLLYIKGKREETKEEKEDNFTRREFNYNSFERTFSLPENAKEDSIKAKYENGVLKITLTKTSTKKATAKKVTIK